MEVRFIYSIHEVDRQQWNRLCTDDYPFNHYEFLAALEDSGCTANDSGWQVAHVVVYEGQELVAAMPGYIKYHSYGEYVFDWAWADAYQRFGFNYYPKWINAIPFTPCTGPRLLTRVQQESTVLIRAICTALETACEVKGYSSWHCLFPTEDQSNLLLPAQTLQRLGCQFHWFNHGYHHFDDFLARMTSRKRKNITKERNQVRGQGISFIVKEGVDVTLDDMDLFYALYRNTYLKRSGHSGYLSQDFFRQLTKTFSKFIVLVCAVTEQQSVIAAALFFRDQYTLYGRYWGCFEEYQFLHFETCYYQGIEYAIAHQLQRFDGGAQGEHKIARGFEPVLTYSNHAIKSSQFRAAIENFLEQEKSHIQSYIQEANQLLPFKND